ncbi:MAG: hypothetical protein AUK34_08685 [Ignavibacteria bacterium CG2_30_36_16]|nr:MAG: hypothetical protein AUK34_08685 [Ignavibacteria bacterium CG2_30_36_16]PJB01991.1 MAG: hypothetical protein CO127_01075 [Ignavibacteria bacterium CG_4_9_14_3_um_filter_36_18]
MIFQDILEILLFFYNSILPEGNNVRRTHLENTNNSALLLKFSAVHQIIKPPVEKSPFFLSLNLYII